MALKNVPAYQYFTSLSTDDLSSLERSENEGRVIVYYTDTQQHVIWDGSSWEDYVDNCKTILQAGTNLAGKFGIDQTTDGTTNRVVAKISQTAGENLVQLSGSKTQLVAHRAAVTSTDKCTAITITAADQAAVAGSLTAVAHGIAVAPSNAWGSVGSSAIVTVTPTVNKSIDITIPQSTGATHYDIFLSTATTAPLWVARITEAQRVAGCAITAVATVGAGGSAGIVNVQVVGTGLASTTSSFIVNNAYRPDNAAIVPIECTGNLKAVVTIDYSVTDLRSAPSLAVIPFFSDGTTWFQGEAQTILILGGAVGQSKKQTMYIDVEAVVGFKMLVGSIGGTGGSVSIGVQLI